MRAVPFEIGSVDAHVFRYPLETVVQTSFGTMADRPMLLVRVTDTGGAVGWGEVWCNFPGVGAEHRARLIDSVLAPLLVGRAFEDAPAAFRHLTASTEVLALQCAEPGPFAQAIAGLDTALWDLSGRLAGAPLWRLLGGTEPSFGVYASGLNPKAPEVLAARRHAEGYRAFKLKVGFGAGRDLANLAALREALGPEVRLMVDANQGWSLEQALDMAPRLEEFGLDWLEEPLRADRPWPEWRRLKERTAIPLAGGENLMGDAAFDTALGEDVLHVVQPDLAKWGGLSACLPLAKRIRATGRRYCPHYLGGGIGLLASAHLLAAAGGDGILEIDGNPNPLRELLCGPLSTVEGGRAGLTAAPGLGVEPDLAALALYAVSH
ncbi:MAG: mandelate racemase/muconate lactonizing enzyme family protein [Thalassobaculum sp.]|uniref:mandelate racemase/muconate lactonizing enzyme family protein n=1 Tax=Thalassobaculum sp. TaxID=2022740 RepID=UPI0032EBAAAF